MRFILFDSISEVITIDIVYQATIILSTWNFQAICIENFMQIYALEPKL